MSTAVGTVTAATAPYRSRREVDRVKKRILVQARPSSVPAHNFMSTHLVIEIETTNLAL
jgi:hypothetical protein